MYNIAKFILAGLIILLGMFMFLFPNLSVKKEKRDDPQAVANIKKQGIVLMVCGFFMIIMEFLLLEM